MRRVILLVLLLATPGFAKPRVPVKLHINSWMADITHTDPDSSGDIVISGGNNALDGA